MAKKQKGGNGSRGRLRVFFAEFDGDDATIQEGLRAISTAVNKTFQPNTVVKLLPQDESVDSIEEYEELQDAEEYSDDEVFDAAPTSTSRSKRKPPTMTLVKALNLLPDDKQSLRDFFADKQPKTQLEQVAVFVYYLRRILEIDGVTANHVFTCFKDVAKRPPNDLPQIIRNCASRKGWVDPSDSNAIEITNLGENLIEHDLPRTNGDGS